MKKVHAGCLRLLAVIIILLLCGCSPIGSKSASLAWVYTAAAIISLALLAGCFFSVRANRKWFLLLFSSVAVVNIGYCCLAFSSCLEMALMANRLAYLGSVFLPLSMLMIILDVTQTPYKKQLPAILLGLAVIVFLIAASPGIVDIYYKEVHFQVIDGVASLEKTYGPLHGLYLFYLMGYFGTIIFIILQARRRKTIETTAHAVILAIAVFVNIGVWLIEQLTSIDFEVLSVSYIISELFLLGAQYAMSENQRLREQFQHSSLETAGTNDEKSPMSRMLESPLESGTVDPARMEAFMNGLSKLTPTERIIFDAHVARMTSKEILAHLNIKENTLKYHNRNLYGKLCVSSRAELLEMYKHVKSAGTAQE